MKTDKPSQKKNPDRVDVYTEFILWFAMPPAERAKLGIKNQGQFADYYKVSPNTLSRWKDRMDFETRVDKIQMMWGKEKTADVIQGIYRAAVKGNPMSQLLWLQYRAHNKSANGSKRFKIRDRWNARRIQTKVLWIHYRDH